MNSTNVHFKSTGLVDPTLIRTVHTLCLPTRISAFPPHAHKIILYFLVGATGFEPVVCDLKGRCHTGLGYTPNVMESVSSPSCFAIYHIRFTLSTLFSVPNKKTLNGSPSRVLNASKMLEMITY